MNQAVAIFLNKRFPFVLLKSVFVLCGGKVQIAFVENTERSFSFQFANDNKKAPEFFRVQFVFGVEITFAGFLCFWAKPLRAWN